MFEKYLNQPIKVEITKISTKEDQAKEKEELRKERVEALKVALTPRQEAVYNELKRLSPQGITAKELALDLHKRGIVSSPDRNSVHPRLKELVDMGLVKVAGKKTCRYTERNVSVYKYKN